MSVLIIEDDRPFVELLRHWLGERKIRIAESLAAAKQMISSETPKFLVVDLSLPDSTAMQTLSRIRELRNEAKDAVVIVITGYPDACKYSTGDFDLLLSKDDRGFFSKLSSALVNPPRPPNVPVPAPLASRLAEAEEEVREIVE